jgi:hypothetical protein
VSGYDSKTEAAELECDLRDACEDPDALDPSAGETIESRLRAAYAAGLREAVLYADTYAAGARSGGDEARARAADDLSEIFERLAGEVAAAADAAGRGGAT